MAAELCLEQSWDGDSIIANPTVEAIQVGTELPDGDGELTIVFGADRVGEGL